MDDYISREDVCLQLLKQESIDGQPRAIRRARRIVANCPATDVVEVRHGRWQNPEDAECYQCSVCGKYRNQEHGLNAPIFDKFCPNCGAVMDGGPDA